MPGYLAIVDQSSTESAPSGEVIPVQYRPFAPSPATMLSDTKTACEALKQQTVLEIKEARSRSAKMLLALRDKVKGRAIKKVAESFGRELSETLQAIDRLHRDTLQQSLATCAKLALSVAKEVIGREISDSSSVIARISRELNGLAAQNVIAVAAHPSAVDDIRDFFSKTRFTITVKPDSDIDPGNARITVPAGTIELDWANHLNQIQSQIQQDKFITTGHSDE